jgi:hypothetical protein
MTTLLIFYILQKYIIFVNFFIIHQHTISELLANDIKFSPTSRVRASALTLRAVGNYKL